MRTTKWTVIREDNEEQEGRENRKEGAEGKNGGNGKLPRLLRTAKLGCGFDEARRHRASLFAPGRAEQPCFSLGGGGAQHNLSIRDIGRIDWLAARYVGGPSHLQTTN